MNGAIDLNKYRSAFPTNFAAFDYLQLANLSDEEVKNVLGVADFFTYQLDIPSTALAAGATANQSFAIQGDSNFMWQMGVFQLDSDPPSINFANVNRLNAPMLVQIIDQSSGSQLASNAVPIGTWFGSAAFPLVLPKPHFFWKQSQISVIVTNISATTAFTLRLSFHGTKIFN